MVLLPGCVCCKSCESIIRGGNYPQSIEVDLSGSSAKSCSGEIRRNTTLVATASVSFPSINGTYSLSPTASNGEYIYNDSNISIRFFSFPDGSISLLTLSFKVPHTADDKEDAQAQRTVTATYSNNGTIGRFCDLSTFETYYDAAPPGLGGSGVSISFAMGVPPTVGRVAFVSGCKLPVLVTCHANVAYEMPFSSNPWEPLVTGSFDNVFRNGSVTYLVAYIPVTIAAVRSIYSAETVNPFGPVDRTTCRDSP